MTAIASTDVAVTIELRDRSHKRRRNRVKLVFGDGALTYPANGVPLPVFGRLGMKRNLSHIHILDGGAGVGLIWKYDKVNNTMRAYVQGYAHATGGSDTLDDYRITAGDGVTTNIAVSLTTGAGAATAYLGGLVELATAATFSQQTLFIEAVGF